MSNKNNTQNKPNKQSRATRILALVLAGLMLLGAATVVFSILAELGHDHSSHNTQTQVTTTHDPSHNH